MFRRKEALVSRFVVSYLSDDKYFNAATPSSRRTGIALRVTGRFCKRPLSVHLYVAYISAQIITRVILRCIEVE